MQDTGYLGLVHWDDPERWYGEGGGRGVQDGEHVFIHASLNAHLDCFHVLAFVNTVANEFWGTRVFLNYGFLRVYAQQWDFWVIR